MPYLNNEQGRPVWLCYYPSPDCEALETEYQPYAKQGLTSFISGDDDAIMAEFTPPLSFENLAVFTYCPDVCVTHVDTNTTHLSQLRDDIQQIGELSPVDMAIIYGSMIAVWTTIIMGIVRLFVIMLNRMGN